MRTSGDGIGCSLVAHGARALLMGAVLVCLAYPQPAQAYLDPGTGSMILQVLVAGVLGGLFAIKMYWRQLKARFTGRSPEEDRQPSEPSGSSDERD